MPRRLGVLVAMGVAAASCGPAEPARRAAVTPLPHVAESAAPPALPALVRVSPPGPAGPLCPDASPGAAVRNVAPPDVGAVPAYALVSASGLASCVVRVGTGDVHPTPEDTVSVRYVGWSTAGVSFDTSLGRSDTVTFPLRHLIQGWVEGVPSMVTGEIRRFWIPASLAYQGRPGPPAGMLVFDIELVSVAPAPPP